jgi:mono/diheme cytochrome c family protein
MRTTVLTIGMALAGLTAVAQDYAAGEKVFKMNCSSCHKMEAKLIGPPLMNVVADQGEDWTTRWIKNNEELRKSGDAHAIAIYEEYNRQVMPSYSYLSDQELSDLVLYLKDWNDVQAAKVVEAPAPTADNGNAPAPAAEKVQWSSAAKLAMGIVAVALLLTVVTMYTLLQAFKAIVRYRLNETAPAKESQ